MSKTDYLGLGEHKIFTEVLDGLPKNVKKTVNLLTVRDSVLFTWDFLNNCVLTLNVKAVRSKGGDNIAHQKLLPLRPPLFTPEILIANESLSLVAVAGPYGILVLELPARCPPYGAFDNNKELVYCRSHSLDERLLSCNELVEVRQVKFHPGSANDSHILALTSDNTLRLYKIENHDAVNLGVYSVGDKPSAFFPGSKTPFLDLFGEIAVDFDFGCPEIIEHKTDIEGNRITKDLNDILSLNVQNQNLTSSDKIKPKEIQVKKEVEMNWSNLVWPIYILRGDCTIYTINISLSKKCKPILKGPLPFSTGSFDANESEACSIIHLNTIPQMLCIAMSNGTLCQGILLDIEENILDKLKQSANTFFEVPTKELFTFETVELELGLTTTDDDGDKKYKCPIFLQKDESKIGRYFAIHSAGVHSITISCIENLHNFIQDSEDADATSDIFMQPTMAEYLVCTKTTASEAINPVIGCSLYYEPTSILTLLGDGNLVTLCILSTTIVPPFNDFPEENKEVTSPLKKMLKEPFDQYIEKILKKSATQPVLKLTSTMSPSQEQCYELLQRASQVFREDYFKYYTKAVEEIDKRIQALRMMKINQLKEVGRMQNEKQLLQQKAENLAEKYEDIKDKQDDLVKRCVNLLLLVSRKKSTPSDAEKEFVKELNETNDKMTKYVHVIDKLKSTMKYQEIQMANWKTQEANKITAFSDVQANTIKVNLKDTAASIASMVKEVNEYKKQLNLK